MPKERQLHASNNSTIGCNYLYGCCLHGLMRIWWWVGCPKTGCRSASPARKRQNSRFKNFSAYWRIQKPVRLLADSRTCPPTGGTCPAFDGIKVFIFFTLTFNFFTVFIPPLQGLIHRSTIPTRGCTPCYLFRPVGAEDRDKGAEFQIPNSRFQIPDSKTCPPTGGFKIPEPVRLPAEPVRLLTE